MNAPGTHPTPRSTATRPVAARARAAGGLALVAAVSVSLASGDARAQVNTLPRELDGVTITERLGAEVPRSTRLRDHTGRAVQLGDYFDGRRPVAFMFFYDRCPSLCSFVMNGMLNALRQTQWTVGEQYDVVMLSIDPLDSASSLSAKRNRVMGQYRGAGRTVNERGWHVLGGEEGAVRRVADAFGYGYRYDARQQQYAHPGALFLLTPNGRLARYFYGISYDANAVRFGLLEASEGRSVTTVERLLMFCYHYDPQAGRYVVLARRVMALGGAATALALGGLLTVLWGRERRRRTAHERNERNEATQTPHEPLEARG